jgi:hypothetical protein
MLLKNTGDRKSITYYQITIQTFNRLAYDFSILWNKEIQLWYQKVSTKVHELMLLSILIAANYRSQKNMDTK